MLIDQQDRDNIISEKGSLMISASAGSGKTTIMIEKIKRVLSEIENHKTVAAITFTNKATQEIVSKAKDLGVEKSFVASTNNAFVETEIIRPFIRDAFGESFNADFIIEFGNEHKFNHYQSGVKQLKNKQVMGGYVDNKKNFIFEIALKVLENSRAAREYLQAKYSMIFIDEYQDSDKDMHELFMYFYNDLDLALFIVGDEKQAIYHWRGADENIFEKVPSTFKNYSLIKNFRCHDEIINYANLLYEPDYFNDKNDIEAENVLHIHNSDLVFTVDYLIKNGEIDISKEITIIAKYNYEAANYASQLEELGYEFIFIPRTPLDEGTPNSHVLVEVAKYIIQDEYSVYDLIVQTNQDEESIKVNKLKRLLLDLEREITRDIAEEQLQNCCNYLGVNLTEDERRRFYKTIRDSELHIAFEDRKDIHQIMTVYSSKGLEFDQVISKSDYYSIHEGKDRQNHYVCITRAKEKFIMLITDGNYENFINRKIKSLGMEESGFLYGKINPGSWVPVTSSISSYFIE